MKATLLLLTLLTSSLSFAQYNACAARSEVTETKSIQQKDKTTGKIVTVQQEVPVTNVDNFGNATGNNYDLAIDGAFTGQTIVILNMCQIDLSGPKAALAEKGFGTFVYMGAPDPANLKEALAKGNQVWVISGVEQKLNNEHAQLIKDFYETGRGVYIWGDNDPCNADANFVANYLIGASLTGNYYADQNIGLMTEGGTTGIRKDHLISTGIVKFYEGITISHVVDPNQLTTPLMWSTDGGTVAAIVDDQQHRLIIDGGFTRLYYKWDSAGTGRYVKNAAAWLANFERFGDEVLSEEFKKK